MTNNPREQPPRVAGERRIKGLPSTGVGHCAPAATLAPGCGCNGRSVVLFFSMEYTPLTEEQRCSFVEQGYLIVRDALDGAAIQRLLEAGDRLMEGFQFEGYYAHRRDGLVQEPALIELATHPTTVPLIVQLLGTNIHITNTALIYKHPQRKPDAERNWHRDVGAHLDIGPAHVPRVGLKIGYCLTDFSTPDSGMTLVVPNSNSWHHPLPIPKGRIDPLTYEEPHLNPGDAFLFENRLYHAAGYNFGRDVAKIVMYGYHYRWIKPDYYLRHFNGRVQPDRDLLALLDDAGRQLLGATEDSRGRESEHGIDWPLQEWAAEYRLGLEQSPHTVEA